MTYEQTLQWLKNNKGWIDHHEVPDDVIDSCIEALTELEELKRSVKREEQEEDKEKELGIINIFDFMEELDRVTDTLKEKQKGDIK